MRISGLREVSLRLPSRVVFSRVTSAVRWLSPGTGVISHTVTVMGLMMCIVMRSVIGGASREEKEEVVGRVGYHIIITEIARLKKG